ncbi:uncharacterized protein LOC143208441 [Lasioglossum baleicum]|uniref:uncharacterized protein LOC143208441 n=1 Tax=Lasioglossum baleicum TaxID=434251 RepID=UPI003FCCBE42
MYYSGKIRNVQMFIINQTRRHFFTNNIQNNIHKQSRVMKKLLRKNELKRGRIEGITFSETMKRGPSVHTTRRMNVLNKVLMEHITDFMSTGELDPRLENKCIEICFVKITQDFKQINIYWIDNSLDKSDTIEILNDCAHRLRYELCQLYVMGNLPPISFVKYKRMDIAKEVERKLAIADYGEDYQPSLYPLAVNCTVSLKTFTNVDQQSTDSPDDTFNVTLPVMQHDVFNLDHNRIMSKIKVSLSQSRQMLKKRATSTELNLFPAAESVSQNDPNFLTVQEQEEQFEKFLKDKQRERRRKYKKDRSNMDVLNEDGEDDFEDDYVDDFHADEFTDDNESMDR